MNDIKSLAQRFRAAAAMLEQLIGIDTPTVNETPRTAAKIVKELGDKKTKKVVWTKAKRAKQSKIIKAMWRRKLELA